MGGWINTKLEEIDQVKDNNIEDGLPERHAIQLEGMDPMEMLEDWYKTGEKLKCRGKTNPNITLTCNDEMSIDSREYDYVTALIQKFQLVTCDEIKLHSILIHELSNDHRPLFIGENVAERNIFSAFLNVAGIKQQQWVNRLVDRLCEFISKENQKKRTLL
jgi:hypothetical protein